MGLFGTASTGAEIGGLSGAAACYEVKANTEIAKLDTFEDFLEQTQRRIRELTDLVKTVNDKAIEGLTELESKPFKRERDAGKFQQVALLIKALAEIMKTPVLDAEGNLNQATATLKAKYRAI